MFTYNEKKLFATVLSFKIIVLILFVAFFGSSKLLWSGDALEYVDFAKNIVAGNGFSRSVNGVFVPAHDRVPLYPGIIGLITIISTKYFIVITALFQAILAALTALLVYRIGLFFMQRRWAVFAAILSVVEPVSVFMHMAILAETLLVFCIVCGLYFFLRYQAERKWVFLALSALAFMLAAYTKPVAMYVTLLPILFLAVDGRTAWKPLLIFCGIILLVAAPWLVRNYALFHMATMSTYGSKALCGYQVSAVFSVANRFVETTPGIAMAEVWKFARYRELQELCNRVSPTWMLFVLAREYPSAFIKTNFLATLGYLTTDGYAASASSGASGSPHNNYLTPAVFAGPAWRDHIKEAVAELSLFQIFIIILGRAFWSAIILLALVGSINLLRSRATRVYGLLILLVIVYFSSLSILGAAFAAGARYRFEVSPLLFLLAVSGIFCIVKKRWFFRKNTSP